MIHISVKTLGTLARGLRVVEAVAEHQPIGLTELSRVLDEDKSALQRTLATLHDAGWIRPLPDSPPRWEVSTKPLIVAGRALTSSPLPVRARALLGSLRDATGETAHLAVLDNSTIAVVDVAEGKQIVRTTLQVGQIHPAGTSAAGRAICALLDPDARADVTPAPATLLTDDDYAEIRARGWSLCEGAVQPGSTSIAAAVTDSTGLPVGAVIVSGPETRLTPDRYAEIGALVRDVAAELKGARQR
ncbi:IclR family transcriptional regulator [Prescottella equi]|uniref:IclR family transcriptional regulator n=1 Tax=Rhodococcus hoagii TaxID=43767 RepID=UPI0009C131A0|nr:IclR family transcriptional regulator [Prescottella equi]NKZ77037.1 helix-turn-helix domain-containing protein [Prescottella equi]OQQ37604.1 IclR family transcriptional regulator [Prescottella equi]ORL33857.1 IclR family transcriptional regulator [Prescottella equi]ORL90016.1 IclR family transcriptional regulator [Prescottella equi]ORM19092.1 IclR family transcriptional regulator [Prescottella equi]